MTKTKPHFSRKLLAIPYGLFLFLFVLIPLLIIVYYAFTDGNGSFTLKNFREFQQQRGRSYRIFYLQHLQDDRAKPLYFDSQHYRLPLYRLSRRLYHSQLQIENQIGAAAFVCRSHVDKFCIAYKCVAGTAGLDRYL